MKKKFLVEKVERNPGKKEEKDKNKQKIYDIENILYKKKTYNNLIRYTAIILNIRNNYLSLFEPIEPRGILNFNFYLIFSHIQEKYKNLYNFDFSKILEIAPHSPIPYNIPKKNYYHIYNNNILKDNILQNKRKREEEDNEIDIKSQLDLNINKKNKNNNKNSVLFDIFKIKNKENNFSKKYVKSSTPGRKKKNSGEYGAHNKYSKDNMMRKLKNKILDSARRLIRLKLKEESKFNKNFGELQKIEGAYNQELNIKFNFWFYLQKLGDIFQLKASNKYSNDYMISNHDLIKKIYKEYSKDDFPLTKKLLEMPFYKFFHEIFLNENPNWIKIFNIDNNVYDINYLIQILRTENYKNENDKNIELYLKKIYDLAKNYELFYLMKRPRVYHLLNLKKFKKKKKCHNEDNKHFYSEAKYIINELNKENNDSLKIEFLKNAIIYKPELISFLDNLDKNMKKNRLYVYKRKKTEEYKSTDLSNVIDLTNENN